MPRYFILVDSNITPEILATALAESQAAEDIERPNLDLLFDAASHLTEDDWDECDQVIRESLLDDPEYDPASQHIIEFESPLDHQTLWELIFE